MGHEKSERYDATIDVGIIAIALIENPAQNDALSVLEDALRERIKVLIPLSVILGAYHVLVEVYRSDEKEVTNRLLNLLKARKIMWYETIKKDRVDPILEMASEKHVESWDAYLISIMEDFGIKTIYTTDLKDFSKFPQFDSINPISEENWDKYTKWFEEKIKKVSPG